MRNLDQNHQALGEDFLEVGREFATKHLDSAESVLLKSFLEEMSAESLGDFLVRVGQYLQSDNARRALGMPMASKRAAAVLQDLMGYVFHDTQPCGNGFSFLFAWPRSDYKIRKGTIVTQRKSSPNEERLHIEFNGHHVGIAKIASPSGYVSAPVCVFGADDRAKEAAARFVRSDTPMSSFDLKSTFFPPWRKVLKEM